MRAEPGKDYFELFGLPVAYDVDSADLTARYRALQGRVHPDRFAGASDTERRLSLQLTTLINEAFQVLKDPVRRGRYLLELRGVAMDDAGDTVVDPAFLAEQMELRERLEQLRAGPDPRRRLDELAGDLARRLQAKGDEFRGLYSRGEANRARAAVREMQFLDKLRREIEDLEAELT